MNFSLCLPSISSSNHIWFLSLCLPHNGIMQWTPECLFSAHLNYLLVIITTNCSLIPLTFGCWCGNECGYTLFRLMGERELKISFQVGYFPTWSCTKVFCSSCVLLYVSSCFVVYSVYFIPTVFFFISSLDAMTIYFNFLLSFGPNLF